MSDPCRVSWAGLWMMALLGGGCGRVGFDALDPSLLPDSGPGARDDSGQVASPDATVGPDAAPPDAAIAPDATTGDAALPPDASAALDAAVMDAGLDATAMDAGPADAGPPDAAGADDGGVEDAGPPPAPGDFCEDVPPLAAPPTIDGVLEPGLTLREPPRLGWTGARPIPAGHAAAYAVAYRPDGLYFFVAVADDTPVTAAATDPAYFGDSVELYVDDDGAFTTAGEYDVPGTVQFIVAAPPAGEASVVQADRWNNVPTALGAWTSTRFGAFRTADGYAVEALVVAADLDLGSWTLASAQSVGLALGINIAEQAGDPDADQGDRLGQYFNRLAATPRGACGRAPFCTSEAFCVVPLSP